MKHIKPAVHVKNLTLCIMLLLFIYLDHHIVMAQDAEGAGWQSKVPGNFSGNIGLFSRYVSRGRVQSDDNPALQGSLDYSVDIADNTSLFLGVWGSNVDFNDGNAAKVEIDVYGGINHTIDKLTLKAGALQYYYPGAGDHRNYDYYEILGAVSYDFDMFTTMASIKYSPDSFGSSGPSAYYKLEANMPLPYDFSVSTHVARQEVDESQKFGVRDYNHWGAGVAYMFKGVRISADYTATTIDDRACADDWCNSRVVFGISKSF